jgi:hypothetical protein
LEASLNFARRTKIIAFSALLAALALTASGCAIGGGNRADNHYVEPPVPKVKLATLPVIYDPDAEGWNSMAGEVNFAWSEADKASMEKNGKAILEVLIEDHPEFTVEGFQRTPEEWDSKVAPKLQSLTLSSAWPILTNSWTKETPAEDGRIEEGDTAPFEPNVVLTNSPEILNGDDYPNYDIIRSWKSSDGEQCSVSDKPYEIDLKGISSTTRPEGDDFASAYPILSGQYEVTIHCKEGGKLKSVLSTNLQMKKENGEWLLSSASMFNGSGLGAGKIEK